MSAPGVTAPVEPILGGSPNLGRFEAPILAKSLAQIGTSLGLFIAACAVMYVVYPISYALTLLLAVLACQAKREGA